MSRIALAFSIFSHKHTHTFWLLSKTKHILGSNAIFPRCCCLGLTVFSLQGFRMVQLLSTLLTSSSPIFDQFFFFEGREGAFYHLAVIMQPHLVLISSSVWFPATLLEIGVIRAEVEEVGFLSHIAMATSWRYCAKSQTVDEIFSEDSKEQKIITYIFQWRPQEVSNTVISFVYLCMCVCMPTRMLLPVLGLAAVIGQFSECIWLDISK